MGKRKFKLAIQNVHVSFILYAVETVVYTYIHLFVVHMLYNSSTMVYGILFSIQETSRWTRQLLQAYTVHFLMNH